MTEDEQVFLNRGVSPEVLAVKRQVAIELVNIYYAPYRWFQWRKRNLAVKKYIDGLWDQFGPVEYGNDY